jgi:hypothetical protein
LRRNVRTEPAASSNGIVRIGKPPADPVQAPPNLALFRSAAKKRRAQAKPAPRNGKGRPTKDHLWRQPLLYRPKDQAI